MQLSQKSILMMKFHFDQSQFFNLDEWEEMTHEAARTIVRLPPVHGRGFRTSWPDWLRDANLAYGYNQESVRLGPPSAQEIDRLDIVLDVVWSSNPDDCKLVMSIAFSAQKNGWPRQRGPAWTQVARRLGIHKDTLRSRYAGATERMWAAGVAKGHLNRDARWRV